jgi:hypothetical protein
MEGLLLNVLKAIEILPVVWLKVQIVEILSQMAFPQF